MNYMRFYYSLCLYAMNDTHYYNQSNWDYFHLISNEIAFSIYNKTQHQLSLYDNDL